MQDDRVTPPDDTSGGSPYRAALKSSLSRAAPHVRHAIVGFASAALAAYLAGAAAWTFEQWWSATGLAGRVVAPIIGRRLTAEAPARFERYEWVVNPIPETEYHGGERVVAWPELVLAWEAADGHTRWLAVRGLPNNSDPIQRYMAHFAGVFGLPWIDYVLPESAVRRLSYDRKRPTSWGNQPGALSREEEDRLGYTWDTYEVASATDRDVDQLALLWAAPAPALSVRYDPSDPAHAYPAPLLAALSRPLSRSIDTWIVAIVSAILGAAMLKMAFWIVLRPHHRLALVLWLIALPTAPLWTPHVGLLADYLGVSRAMTTMFGRGLTDPVKLHRVVVEPIGKPGPSRALRWSLAPEEGAALLAQLALPPPRLGWSELLERDGGEPVTIGLGVGPLVVQRFQSEVRSALLLLPDEKLAPLLAGLCDPRRPTGFGYMLRPAMERLAADPARSSAVREWAAAFRDRRVHCR